MSVQCIPAPGSYSVPSWVSAMPAVAVQSTPSPSPIPNVCDAQQASQGASLSTIQAGCARQSEGVEPLVIPHENDQATTVTQASSSPSQISAALQATLWVDVSAIGLFALSPLIELGPRWMRRNVDDVAGTFANHKKRLECVKSGNEEAIKEWGEETLKELDKKRPKQIGSNREATSLLSPPVCGGSKANEFSPQSVQSPSYFNRGNIMVDPKTHAVLVIDDMPPEEVGQYNPNIKRLAYYFPTGLPRAGYEQSPLDVAVNAIRERVRLEAKILLFRKRNKALKDKPEILPEKYPSKWNAILNSNASGSPAESLLEHYAYNETAIRKQGWKGDFKPNPTSHPWAHMRDWELEYPKALSDVKAERAVGAVLGRPWLFFKGMFQTANRPREQGQKGGRTLWTSLPATLLVGGIVATLAVLLTQQQQQQASKSSTGS